MIVRFGPGALLLTAVVVLMPATPAYAHTAVPTDVRTTIVEVSPPTPQIHIELVAGGTFVRLRVDRGTTVIVVGYQGEPYLRVGADDAVDENVRSPAVYLNRTRLGGSPVPAIADAKADPEWRRAGSGGRYTWHDHRTHWMASGIPPRPVEWTVPLIVNARTVTIHGRYEAVRAPSAIPWILVMIGALVTTIVFGWRHPRATVLAVFGASVIALPVASAVARVPAGRVSGEVGVVLCALSAVAAVVAFFRRRIAGPLLTAAGLTLLAWAGQRTDVLGHAVLVTGLPPWLDRLSVALGIGVGLGAAVAGHAALVPDVGATTGASRPADVPIS